MIEECEAILRSLIQWTKARENSINSSVSVAACGGDCHSSGNKSSWDSSHLQVNVKVFAVKSKILADNGLTCDRYSNGSDIV